MLQRRWLPAKTSSVHHLLHGAARITPRANANTEVTRQFSVSATCDTLRLVLLQVIPILVYGRGQWVKTFALFDSASETTLVTVTFAKKLDLKEKDSQLTLRSWHGHDPERKTTATNFTIAAWDNSITYNIEDALTVPRLNLNKRTLNWPKDKSKWEHLQDLPLQSVDTSKVQVLIGMDVAEAQWDVGNSKSGGENATRMEYSWQTTATGAEDDRSSILHLP